MAYLLAGPFVALVGVVAVFFVLRRKSVDKRSMYSARRQQIEHKVRAARQRTLTPHGHVAVPAETAAAAAAPFAQAPVQPAARYEAPVYEPPPAAPPPPPIPQPVQPAAPPPWEQPSIPAPSPFSAPVAPPEPFRPAPEPSPTPAPRGPVGTSAPRPAESLPPAETVAPAASSVAPATSATAAGWSVVATTKASAVTGEPQTKKKKDKHEVATSDWQLASGEAPGIEEESDIRRPSRMVMAIAQYAVLVVGLVMVLIGVLVMLANSHVT